MADTFTWAPTYGAKLSRAPRVNAANFGDGYVQRLQDGINTNPQSWALTFNVSSTVAGEIDDFLSAQAGAHWFWFTPPLATTALKFVCLKWDKTETDLSNAVVTATFDQDFSPG